MSTERGPLPTDSMTPEDVIELRGLFASATTEHKIFDADNWPHRDMLPVKRSLPGGGIESGWIISQRVNGRALPVSSVFQAHSEYHYGSIEELISDGWTVD